MTKMITTTTTKKKSKNAPFQVQFLIKFTAKLHLNS